MRVELDRVSRSFGKVAALRDVTASIPAGGKFALIGPNGSGKTTLLRALVGLIEHEGAIRVDGRRAGDVRDRIAYAPQIAPQMAAPVAELVRAVCALRGGPVTRVEETAALLGLDLKEIAKRPFRALSGGMRQKVLLALALAAEASLYVLDEPTASLDVTSRARFLNEFRRARGDATLVLCSHRLDEIHALVDHVLMLEDGRVVFDGPAPAFLGARASIVVRARVEGDLAAAWLARHGYVRAGDGWWERAVGREDRRAAVAALVTELGPALADVATTEDERLELGKEARHA